MDIVFLDFSKTISTALTLSSIDILIKKLLMDGTVGKQ